MVALRLYSLYRSYGYTQMNAIKKAVQVYRGYNDAFSSKSLQSNTMRISWWKTLKTDANWKYKKIGKKRL